MLLLSIQFVYRSAIREHISLRMANEAGKEKKKEIPRSSAQKRNPPCPSWNIKNLKMGLEE